MNKYFHAGVLLFVASVALVTGGCVGSGKYQIDDPTKHLGGLKTIVEPKSEIPKKPVTP